MAIHELVAFIQFVFPPSGQIPQPPSGPPEDNDVEGLPPELSPIPRHPIPNWIEPGEGASFPADGVLVIEGETPAAQQGLPAAIDILAYYLPFHFYANGWGVYLRASGILSVASMLASASGRGLSGDLLNLASAVLLQHERFHFFSEIACSRGELVFEDELYRHYFHDRGATAVEEALSNAHAFRTALRRQPAAIREEVKQWMQAQGPGYRDFARCLTPSAFTGWCRIATRRMRRSARVIQLSPMRIDAGKARFSNIGPWPHTKPAPTEFLFTGLARSTAPTYLVRDVASVGVLRPFPKYAGIRILVHTNDHPPPHIHVEIPPGRDFTRLEWPALQPLPGDSSLTGKQRKSFDEYLSKYREQIDQKVQQVYQSSAK
jgi:hypothetical protein